MKKLTEAQKKVLLRKGTERPFTGKYWNHKEKGTYYCAQCTTPLFSSKHKFNSGTGWPSFTEAKNVVLREDNSHGMRRVEVLCKKCKGHLGHVFDDMPKGKIYCVNSAALDFKHKNL